MVITLHIHGCLHLFSLLSHFQITQPLRSRCSRIRVSEKRRRLRNRQRLAGCLHGHSTPGGKLRAESGRTEFFAVGSSNTAAINNAAAFRYCGRDSGDKVLARVSVHLLSLCGRSDFPCANCPNGLVRDDDAAELNILSQLPSGRHLDYGRQTSSLRVRAVLRRPGAVLRRLVACAPLLAPRAFHLRKE